MKTPRKIAHGLFWPLLLSSHLASAAPVEPEVTVTFVGDVLLDSKPGERVAQGVDPFAEFAADFAASDLVIGNLECAVATGGQAIEKPFTFRAHPRVVDLLVRHRLTMSLANNHSGDYGQGALLETMQHLRAQGVPFFGAGEDLASAHRALVVERRGLRIFVLGYNEFLPRSFEAGPRTPGVAWSEDEQVLFDVRRARSAGADLVITFMHWGWEHEGKPSERQRTLARKIIDAGADAVVGTHPHVTQGVELYRGKVIAYSLGNFVFDGFEDEDNNTGWVLKLGLAKRGTTRWEVAVARLDADGLPKRDPRALAPCGDGLHQRICRAGQAVSPGLPASLAQPGTQG